MSDTTDEKHAYSEQRAESSYEDKAYPPRHCDYCGRTYQGPSIYCSLQCTLADA